MIYRNKLLFQFNIFFPFSNEDPIIGSWCDTIKNHWVTKKFPFRRITIWNATLCRLSIEA